MNKTQEKAPRNAAAKPPARPQAPERPSHSGERAEGEGMIAPPPAPAPAHGKASELEGEGNYTAARRYDEGVQRSVAGGDTERLAQEAARALDGPQAAELEKAEQAAKRGHAR